MRQELHALRSFFNQHSSAVTHLAVAHTHFRPYNCTQQQIDALVVEAAKSVRHFRNCFNQLLYGAKARRKPQQYQPLLLTTVEGARLTTDKTLTIHYNFSIGNIPDCISTDELRAVFAHCWVDKAQLSDKRIWLTEARDSATNGWHNYITKEAERGELATWDMANTQIPYAALANGQRT